MGGEARQTHGSGGSSTASLRSCRKTATVRRAVMSAHLGLGVVAGLLAAGVSVVANLRRGDPHLISTAPDVMTVLIVGLIVSWAVWQAAQRGRTHARVAAHRTA